MNSTTNIVISVFFFITSSAIAQQGDHVPRQMDPDLLTRLRAEAWSHDIKNKIRSELFKRFDEIISCWNVSK